MDTELALQFFPGFSLVDIQDSSLFQHDAQEV